MTKKLLRFIIQTKPKLKTEIVEVYSTHSGDFLGTIHWRNGWRCYVMSYENDIDMSLSCEKELIKFMEELEQKRKF